MKLGSTRTLRCLSFSAAQDDQTKVDGASTAPRLLVRVAGETYPNDTSSADLFLHPSTNKIHPPVFAFQSSSPDLVILSRRMGFIQDIWYALWAQVRSGACDWNVVTRISQKLRIFASALCPCLWPRLRSLIIEGLLKPKIYVWMCL